MSWHDALVAFETALIWTSTGGLVAAVFAWHPVRRALRLLDTDTPGGLGDVNQTGRELVAAIENAAPPPSTAGNRQHGRR